jgi:5'-nucleotidase
MIKKWELICFDLDDTLIDYERTFQAAIHHCFTAFFGQHPHFPQWFAVFKQCCDRYWSDYACRRLTRVEYRRRRFLETMYLFHMKADEKMADEFHTYFDEVVSRFAIPIEGMIPLLHRLRERSIQIGIITNGTSRIQREKIFYLGLGHFFSNEEMIISEEVGYKKPNPAIFHYASHCLAPRSQHRLFVGDSWELDVVGALRANWEAIYFNTRNKAPCTTHRPFAICTNAKQLVSLLCDQEGRGEIERTC